MRRIDVCFTGPMLGGQGTPPNPAEILARTLGESGLSCRTVSGFRHPLLRFAHIAWTIFALRLRCGTICMQLYSGRSFRGDAAVSVLAKVLGYRIIMVLHGGDFPALMKRHPDRVRRVLVRAHTIVTPSSFLAGAVRSHGFEARVIPNIIDVDVHPYHVPVGRPAILWMRTLQANYDPKLAIRALVALRARGVDAVMTLAGQDRGELERVRAEAQARGVFDHVVFPGFLDLDEKRAAFAEHDIFLNTPVADNAPTTLLEAAAAGLVVVSVEVGGIPYLFTHGRNAILVGGRDPDVLAAEIAALLGDPERMAVLSNAGRLLAAERAPARIVPEWADLLAGSADRGVPQG